eukprot:GDKI01025965.1.p1 GENE.GDKI01025965.1~~GDKI01025965.1.p1  ORF type:complete len:106 (-),score=34.77 GDKI01025965.1:246-563(-)
MGLDYFVSDRSHMINQTKAYPPVYKQTPPPWPTIIGFKANCEMNADKYISMRSSEESIYGKVMGIEAFMKMFQGGALVNSAQLKTDSVQHDNIDSAKMAEVSLLA